MNKIFLITISLFVIIGAFFMGGAISVLTNNPDTEDFVYEPSEEEEEEVNRATDEIPSKEYENFLFQFDNLEAVKELKKYPTVKLFAVGDIMLDRGVEKMIKEEGNGDFRFPFLQITDYLKTSDILFGNLESMISDKEGKKFEKTGDVQVHFKAEPEAIDGLIYAGFNVLSVANNHALDYGREVFEDSFFGLKKAGIECVGGGFNIYDAYWVRVEEVKGTKIGFMAYTYPRSDGQYIPWKPGEYKLGVAVIEKEELDETRRDIERAKKEVDVLVISLHWGKEYSLTPTPYKVLLAKSFIDSGADLILGHHPHVVQPVEKYKNGWIAYSLGNFVFDQESQEETMKSIILEVIINNRKIEKVSSTKVRISDNFQPFISE